MRGGIAILVALWLLAACETVEVGPGPAPRPSEAPEPPAEVLDPGDAPCETLSREACLHSVVCTLAAPAGRASSRYVCRPAAGNCEVGLRQLREDQDRCDARTGCSWRDASCYCACRGSGRTAVEDGPEAEPCDCDCAGGPPPGCTPRG
ncbi:MAG: hypothetical protein H6719_31520 [Sandaracinaceae bacterium]|nr:hypothetical protein [Sandaracinaceae bacterium]